jgi:hypothetical protein
VTWSARNKLLGTRSKEVINKMLGDWAGSHGEQDGGVSLEVAFAQYDRDHSGTIDGSELALLLEDLGVEVNEERLRDAFAIFDKNGDGVISFEEFGEWWRRDDVSYVLKRSEAIEPLQVVPYATDAEVTGGAGAMRGSVAASQVSASGRPRPKSAIRGRGNLSAIPEEPSGVSGGGGSLAGRSASATRPRPASAAANRLSTVGTATVKASDTVAKKVRQVAMPIVSYRGAQTKCEVAGLEPNRL